MIEILKQAIDYIENVPDDRDSVGHIDRHALVAALKERLAQPEQEPVAVYGYCPECGAKGVMRERRPDGNDKCANGHTYQSCKATQPPQRKPLTIDECLRDFESWLHFQGQHAFLKAPEGSKNTFWDGRTEDRWLGWKAAHGIKENT